MRFMNGLKPSIMTKHYVKACPIAFMLLLVSLNAIMVPRANGETYNYDYRSYYASNEELISKVSIAKSNNNGDISMVSTNSTGPATNNNNNNNNGNSTCNISAPLNANSRSKINVLPPKIMMNYAGIGYLGELSEAKYRAGVNFPELHIRPQNVSMNTPSNIVHVKKDSCIQFIIIGTPKLLPPSSLAVTAYSAINGSAAAVLDATDYDNTIFRMNLNSGNYILVAAATWLPGSEDVTGYVIYKFVVNVE